MARKAKADVLFSPDGFCSLTTRIPQVLAIHDLAFLHFPQGISRLYQFYYRHYTPQFIRKAAHIITVSDYSKQDILRHYPEASGKISVIYNTADPDFKPLEWEEKEKVKEEWTNGHDFFLYAGAIHPRKNLLNLLKGFSWFKHRHKSGMKLVLAGRIAWGMEDFQELLRWSIRLSLKDSADRFWKPCKAARRSSAQKRVPYRKLRPTQPFTYHRKIPKPSGKQWASCIKMRITGPSSSGMAGTGQHFLTGMPEAGNLRKSWNPYPESRQIWGFKE